MSAAPQSLAHFAALRRQYGTSAALKWSAARVAKKILRLEVSEMVWLDEDCLPTSIVAPFDFSFRFLTVDEVGQIAADSDYELAPEFVDRAAGGFDLCFAALDEHERVAHFGWYALDSIEGRHHMGVPLALPPDLAYMYNAFTHPDFRGRRLHATAMALALAELSHRGIRKLISTIEWTNYASLRSFERLGFINMGRLWTIGGGDARWSQNPQAAITRGVRFGRQAKVAPRSMERDTLATV